VPLEPRSVYRLSFAAQSTTSCDVEVGVQKDTLPSTPYGLSNYRVTLTPTWKVFETQFVTSGFQTHIADARILFRFDSTAPSGAVLSFDNIVLSYVGPATEPVLQVPRDYALRQNFPNPFNPSTTIRYTIPADGLVRLIVYDMLGREIYRLVDAEQRAGAYSAEFNATGMASGAYLCTLQAGKFVETIRMLLVR
jgi:hypothetical protein